MTRPSYKPADTDLESKMAEWRAANDVPEKPGAMRSSVGFAAKAIVFVSTCLLLASGLILIPILLGHAPWLKPFIFLASVLTLFAALWALRR